MTLIIIQTPGEAINWTVDWPNRGLPTGATITASVFTPSSTDFTISGEEIISSATETLFNLTGGVAGSVYQITNTITLSTDEIMEETVTYYCNAANTS